MPKLKTKAVKMSDAKVSFVSLVERGANRIPFKIMKQEKSMSKNAFAGLDLSRMFTKKEEFKSSSEILGVITLKNENLEKVKEQIKAIGFSVDTPEEMEDGSIVFKQGEIDLDDDENDVTVIRVNENVALITKDFRPYNMQLSDGDTSFEDVAKAQGFYPGFGSVMDVLRSSVIDAVSKAEDSNEAASQVQDMFSEAMSYVTDMVVGLPAKAFKVEGVILEQPAFKSEEKSGGKDENAEKSEEKVESEREEKPIKSEDKGGPVLTEEKVSELVTKNISASMEALSAKMGTMFSEFSESVKKSLGGIESKVAEASKIAKEAKDAVDGVVIGGEDTGDEPPNRAKKSDSEYVGREIDTAFMGRVARKARSLRVG